jgi:hypothetical protein
MESTMYGLELSKILQRQASSGNDSGPACAVLVWHPRRDRHVVLQADEYLPDLLSDILDGVSSWSPGLYPAPEK